jgi:glyoxylase-like metal-dependent hydrolase (beta-lactamase superfamily II)
LGARSRENEALNANIGLVLTPRGAVLIDSGATHLSARDIDQAARRVTDQPIRWVINTGGQDHRRLGNSHFHAQGAALIAHATAVTDMQARAGDQMQALKGMLGSRFEGTHAVYPTQLIATPDPQLDLGGTRFELRHRGGGHTPGDMMVWLPQTRVLFTGDIVYMNRMLAVLPVSNTRQWLSALDEMEALNPAQIVPGHGAVTDLATARAETRDYLVSLRAHLKPSVERGEDIGTAARSFDIGPFHTCSTQLTFTRATQAASTWSWKGSESSGSRVGA